MFGFISAREQLVKERQKNAAMQAQIAKANICFPSINSYNIDPYR